MIRQYASAPPPDVDLVRNLELTVRPLAHRPHRWAWDLKDGRDSSWFESMWEFDSEERARRSGLARIQELSDAVRGGSMPAPRSSNKHDHVVVVSRHDEHLYGLFTAAFRGSASVKVIRDRRTRSATMNRAIERRSTDVAPDIRGRGWAIVDRSRTPRAGRIDAAA